MATIWRARGELTHMNAHMLLLASKLLQKDRAAYKRRVYFFAVAMVTIVLNIELCPYKIHAKPDIIIIIIKIGTTNEFSTKTTTRRLKSAFSNANTDDSKHLAICLSSLEEIDEWSFRNQDAASWRAILLLRADPDTTRATRHSQAVHQGSHSNSANRFARLERQVSLTPIWPTEKPSQLTTVSCYFRYFRCLADNQVPPVKERLEMPVATQKTDSGLTIGIIKTLHKQVTFKETGLNLILLDKALTAFFHSDFDQKAAGFEFHQRQVASS